MQSIGAMPVYYLKVTKFSDTLIAILEFSFFLLNLVHTKPLKCMVN